MHVKEGGYPTRLQGCSIIHLYKPKRNPKDCDNHRGICLLQIAGKILSKIILNRPNAHLDQAGLIPESQCGFRKDRGTMDMIFTARRLQWKCQEQNMDLYMPLVDLTKALDTVSRDWLWKLMRKFGCLPRFIAMVRQFHNGMQARAQSDGTLNHFRGQTGSNKTVLWRQHCSVSCFLLCSHVLFRNVRLFSYQVAL